MAPRPARERKKSVGKKALKGVVKKVKKGVDKKAEESFAKELEKIFAERAERSAVEGLRKSVAKEPKKDVAEEPEKSVESRGWKKPASKGNRPPSSGLVLRSMCLFFKLPLEIRSMIYSDVIKSGSLELLRSCQKVYREALEVVYKDSIYPLEEYSGGRQPYFVYGSARTVNQREPIGDKIEHLELNIFPDPKNFGVNHKEIDDLGAHYPELKDPKIRRKNCWIHLDYDGLLRDPHIEKRLVNFLGVFREFDNVFLNIRATFTPRLPHPWVYEPPIALAKFESWFKSLGISLEPFAGPLTWHDSLHQEKRYWEFHPRRESQRG